MTGSGAVTGRAPGQRAAAPLEDVDVLRLWEGAAGLGPIERALALAGPDDGDPSLAEAPLGRCQARLLRLRQALLGNRLEATAACPECRETVELVLGVTDLLSFDGAGGAGIVDVDGHTVSWRSPTPADLAAAAETSAGGGDPETVILERCILSALGPQGVMDPGGLPAPAREAVAAAMAAADPLAEILVSLVCPECGSAFEAEVDVASFVWAELEATASRIVLDVDTLARAYGWTEADVLALGAQRRTAYLRLVTEGLP